MSPEQYKQLINEKFVLNYTTLNITLKELVAKQEFDLAGKIKHVIENNKIAKPEQHAKPFDTSTNYYKVDLSAEDVEKIIDMFFDLEASHVTEDGETTPTSSFYASLIDNWNELS